VGEDECDWLNFAKKFENVCRCMWGDLINYGSDPQELLKIEHTLVKIEFNPKMCFQTKGGEIHPK